MDVFRDNCKACLVIPVLECIHDDFPPGYVVSIFIPDNGKAAYYQVTSKPGAPFMQHQGKLDMTSSHSIAEFVWLLRMTPVSLYMAAQVQLGISDLIAKLLTEYSNVAFTEKAAAKYGRKWVHMYLSPATALGRKRLLREFAELS